MKYSKMATDFIEKEILPKIMQNVITDDNIAEIIDYIIDNYEVPLLQAKEDGEKIDEELLKLVTSIITEITTNNDW